MPKKKPLIVRRVLALILAYVTLCVAGGVVASLFLAPGVLGMNRLTKAVVPSLKVEGIDFDVTSLPQKSRLYASDGKTVLASFYAQNRTVVPIKDISEPMRQAVVAREDRRFFEHSGVDVQGVLRAFIQTFVKKGDTQGGSSLTQQYVKNVLLIKARENNDPIGEYHASEDTIARKIREMLIAVQMEKKYSKMEILQGYLNIAQFGTDNLYGVETAARRYFNTSAKDLTIVQAATIAAITKNPAAFDPSIEQNQPEAQNQRNIVLDLMYQQGYITKGEHDRARNTPLKDTLNIQDNVTNVGCQAAGDAGFFCDYVTKQILNSPEFGKTEADRQKMLTEGGLDIYTTMDVHANAAAMQAARDTIPVDDPSGFEVSIAAIKPGTGEVLAFGSNRIYDATDAAKSDPTHTAINYAVDQKDGGGYGAGVGSTWKPINMVAWMLAGKSINTPLVTSTRYSNSSFNCSRYGGIGVWSVQNSGGGTTSPESPLQGLVRSHNTTQASMAAQIGLCSIADAAKTLGYENSPLGHEDVYDLNSLNPPMTIGAVQASPLTMANVYATLGANGVECTPIAIKKVTDRTGKNVPVPKANCHQAISPEIAQTTAYALNQGVVTPGGEAATTQLDNGRKTFSKTGTNEDTYMTTAGFTPGQVAAFVSVGNMEVPKSFTGMTINGRSMGSWYGMYIATPAWKEFMNNYLNSAGIPPDNNYGNPAPQYMSAPAAAPRTQQSAPQQSTPQRR
ncbi:MAG: penicillin-binding protein [Bifidobacterium tibiigranuli]|uniref:transglycosylase domain-containing protein n=1 Tax=Bifidobacterium tibiigranuli TaxID=2172043 RepID=UPI0026E93CB9|nr:transglycosylase domain-containing protein [Bifidobacterium tibiigranuli]MCI1674465.1 penicillin-binding protein [Bifidobacterium tibiigranuli]MCI1713030.1 penicillin-binding protein [Bifidobacterium tibiigranuli]MCI1834397.1 penicillin-binding protein [Bifidobacterium tibiigranuli]